MVDVVLEASVPVLKVAAGILGASLPELIVGGAIIVGGLYIIYKIAEVVNGEVVETGENTYKILDSNVTNIPIE